jgi:hypothetical protein
LLAGIDVLPPGMRLGLAILALTMLGTVRLGHAGDDRFPPPALRAKAIGCWQLAKDQQLVVTELGKHSVNARLAGTIETTSAFAPWHQADHSFEIPCPRAAKNADFTCRAAPEGNQLRVRVFQLVKDAAPMVADDLLAARCTP